MKTTIGAALALLLAGVIGCAGGPEVKADGDSQYTDAMTREHAEDKPVAGAAADAPATAAEVQGAEVQYATIEGKPISGFLATPAGAPADAPAIIVIHEWWGLNDNIREMARRLAGEGYVALAVDLYEGGSAATPDEARGLMQASMERKAQLQDNLRQAHAFLKGRGAARVASMGWCFGGGWSLQAGLLLGEELDAVVIYYGRLVTEPEDLKPLTAPVLGIFGAEDKGIPVDSVKAFEAALGTLSKPASIHIYEGADHAFANPSGTRYQAEAARDAWDKTVTFLASHLKPVQ